MHITVVILRNVIMENRNSRKGNSRRPSPSNTNRRGGPKQGTGFRKTNAGEDFKKSSASFGARALKSEAKRDGKSSYSKGGSSYGDKPYKRSEGSGGDSFKKPFRKDFGDGDSSQKPKFGNNPDFRKSSSSYGDKKHTGNAFGDKKPRAFTPKVSEDSDRKPFKKSFGDDKPRSFNKGDGEKRPFKPRTEGGVRSFEERKKAGDFERKAKRDFDDKKSEIKSKFTAKSRDQKFGKDVKTPDYDKAFAPKETKQKIKRSAEEKAEGIRLNRYIANSGVCSRRDADLLISSGEVTVNNNIITEMGYIVQPTDIVKYAGRTLKREKAVYVLLNKPKDFITTTNDPDDRRTVMDLVAGAAKERLFPVGRLDRNTTGLLLLTNDGDLAEKLSHPSNKIKKIYQVTLDRPLEDKDFEKIQKGLHLEDGLAEVDDIAIITKDRINLGLEIHIGRNRIVRRIFETLGYEVEKLDRVLYAELTKKDLPRGHWRYLTEQEVINLKNSKNK